MKKLFILFLALTASANTLFADNPTWNFAGKTISVSHTLAGGNGGSWIYEEEKDSETGSFPATFVVLTEAQGRNLDEIPEWEKEYGPDYSAVSQDDIDRLILKPLSDDAPIMGTVAFKHAALNTGLVPYACLRYSIPYQIAKLESIYDGDGKRVGGVVYNYKVTEIVDENISGSNFVNALVIPHTIEYVPKNAHIGFENTDTVWMYNAHCQYEDESAYMLLPRKNLSTIIFMDGFDTIPPYICSDAKKLDSIHIPQSVTCFGKNSMASCCLTSFSIPDNVLSIEERAFDNCHKLTSMTIGKGVNSIGNDVFFACHELATIAVKKGNITYDSRNNCNAIIETATNALIVGCKNTIIPNSVTSIGEGAFELCDMTSFNIPNSVISIGDDAFFACKNLSTITIPNSVIYIGKGAFKQCTSLYSVTLGNSVKTIDKSAFAGCSSLTSITIPSSLTSIKPTAFQECGNLTSIVVDTTNSVYDSRDNCNAIIETATNTLVIGCKNTIIPNSITRIGSYAFNECTGLISVTIPNSVTRIGEFAFYRCTGLTSIELPNSVTSIGGDAFGGCTNLGLLVISNNVNYISYYAFQGCNNLNAIYNYALEPQDIGAKYVFDGDPILGFTSVDKSRCVLYVPANSIEAYKDAEGWNEFTNILPIPEAEKAEVTALTIEPDVTSANIAWPAIEGADSYELAIKDANDNIACALTFNAQGQLTSIAHNAPALNNESQQTQSIGFAFTVTGLEPGTQYSYSITAKNASGTTLSTKTGTFTTKVLEGLDKINQEPSAKSQKLIKDGQMLIFRGEKVYTMTGQEVK